ncbi:Leucine-rich repeat domain superfamily, partial [Sesbania bispinosa]
MSPLQGNIVMGAKSKRKRVMKSSETIGEMDRLSQLPNCILLYIMTFMTTKQAVQTSILSKRWKDLWKYLPDLIANSMDFPKAQIFKNFLSKFLLHCDGSSTLRNVNVDHDGYINSHIIIKIFKYVTSYSMEQLTISAHSCGCIRKNMVLSSSMLSSHFLKYLNLAFHQIRGQVVLLPHILDLPQLLECHLRDVAFTSRDNNGFAEPFSSCKNLTTLAINSCTLHKAKGLFVLNDKLANLTTKFNTLVGRYYKVEMYTPNLKAFTFTGAFTEQIGTLELFKHKLNFLEEATIDVWITEYISKEIPQTLMKWLKKLSNVKNADNLFRNSS